jgi:hypothetical protein
MTLSAGRNLNFRNFQLHHFTTNASHLAKTDGFGENKFPHHNVWCKDTQRFHQIYLNYWGNIMYPENDDELRNYFIAYSAFPRRYIETAMGLVGESINKHVKEPIILTQISYLRNNCTSKYSMQPG